MTDHQEVPPPPRGLGESGRGLWRGVMERYELEQHEARLLLAMCRAADHLDALAAEVERRGPMTADGRVNPALVEHRQQSIAYARMAAALRLPAGDEEAHDAGRRPQRRSGVRGLYAVTGAAS